VSEESATAPEHRLRAGFEQHFARCRDWRQGAFSQVESAFAEIDQWRTQLEQFHQQCRSELDACARQQHTLAASESEHRAHDEQLTKALEALQAELQAAREENRQLKEQLHRGQGEQQQLGQQLNTIESERSSVEEELQLVRTRSLELADKLEAAQREFAEERAQWQNERVHLERKLKLSKQLNVRPAAPPAEHPVGAGEEDAQTAVARPAEHSEASADRAVMGSVLAQFEKIRSERANRRTRLMQEKK